MVQDGALTKSCVLRWSHGRLKGTWNEQNVSTTIYALLAYNGSYLHISNNLVYDACNVCKLLDQSEIMIQLYV
jgi:hypothetical protein